MAQKLNGTSCEEGQAPPLPDSAQGEGQARAFPYSSWGPAAALFGVLLALAAGFVLAIPAIVVSPPHHNKFSTGANVAIQFATELGFLIVPLVVAGRGPVPVREALRRLGVRRFRPSALKWMGAAVGAYLLFSIAYVAVFGPPHQEQIARGFGALPVQVALIVVAAPISEEVCFRGMLFGGLRKRLPRLLAALASAAVFGGLHALTGIGAVPPLIVLGFVFALLYEKTGSIVPGILLHALNNSVALLGQ